MKRASGPEPSSNTPSLWRHFTDAAATTAEDAEVRAAWHKNRPRYAVWLLRVNDEAVQQRVAAVAGALAPWLVPQPDLHVTLAIAGFPQETSVHDDDVSPALLHEQAAALRTRMRRFVIGVHGACAFLAAPFLVVSDDDDQLRQLRAIVDPPDRALTIHNYVPHVTVGTWNGRHATAPLAALLTPFLNLPPLTVPVTAVELVEYAAAEPHARLVTRISVPLS